MPDAVEQRRKLFALMLQQEGIEPSDRPTRQGRDGRLPLSFAQQRLWFLCQFEPDKAAYNIPHAVRLKGALQIDLLRRAIEEIARRHEPLRTCFPIIDGVPIQAIHREPEVDLPVISVEQHAETQTDEIQRQMQQQARIPFDLIRSPLMRSMLLRVSPEEHVLVLIFHHIISDGWSMGIFVRELTLFYNSLVEGTVARLEDFAFQYADYAIWQRKALKGALLEEQLRYWRKQLLGIPDILQLPTDRARPRELSHASRAVRIQVPETLAASLRQVSSVENATLFMTLLAAFQLLLSRHTRQQDIVLGIPVAGRNRSDVEGLIGLFVNTLVLRTDMSGEPRFRELLAAVRETALAAYAHQDLPFEKLVEELAPERDLSRSPLFQVMFMMQNVPKEQWRFRDLEASSIEIDRVTNRFDITLVLEETRDGLVGAIAYNSDLFDPGTMQRMAGHLHTLLNAIAIDPERRISEYSLLSAQEKSEILADWNQTQAPLQANCIHEIFEQQVRNTPGAVALEYEGAQLSYQELNERSNQVAHHLRKLGVGPEILVAVCVERSLEMLVGLLGILKAGGAYVPLDHEYPAERIAFMLEDSGVALLLTQTALTKKLPDFAGTVVELDGDLEAIEAGSRANPGRTACPENTAYVIYTSGSTGTPKGVIVTHGNVANYFHAMNRMFEKGGPGEWVAITSICFDISIMELFWTLSHGDHVTIHPGLLHRREEGGVSIKKSLPLDFSLFFFAAEHGQNADCYKLLLNAARFADKNGFCAIWTPERHFHSFGGIYPNPAVTGAAVAAVTSRVSIRAGSVVAPLHDPVRVVEEWSMVDNLSGGRVSISFASGWHANDFVLAPDHFQDRKQVMVRQINTIRSLWLGEAISRKNGTGRDVTVRTYPRPVQKELPIWITAAGSAETFRLAGEMGAGLLTHLLGQDLQTLARKIAIYRAAYRAAGHPGNGRVALMLHTFVGKDMESTRSLVQGPFCRYLEQSLDLLQGVFSELGIKAELASLSRQELDAVLLHAFERYYRTSSLIGDETACWEMLQQLSEIEVDEIACLIDFGVDFKAVAESLSRLKTLKNKWDQFAKPPARKLIWTNKDLQCTPTFAVAMRDEWKDPSQTPVLRKLLVGGEAFPEGLARDLMHAAREGVYNMYGPTETTIWSSVHRLGEEQGPVPLGKPILNTQIYVLDEHLQPVPIGVPGEGYIGGFGLARGYLNRPELTAEKFVPNPFSDRPGARLYRTGDQLKWRADGTLMFVGRTDHQVKLRGYRIELGEIESVLGQHPAVAQAVAAVQQDSSGDQRLIAYLVARPNQELQTAAIRTFIKQKLPGYMEPSHLVELTELPLTPNGKLDRRLLPGVKAILSKGRPYESPTTPMQKSLAETWATLLKVDRVGIHDNFFHLGGHSLLLIQVIARIRDEFGVEIPLRGFFEQPTVFALAEIIVHSGGTAPVSTLPTIDLVPRNERLPLSREEEVVWLLAQISPDYEGLHTTLAWRVKGSLDFVAVEKSVNRIVHRHENLRTTFATRRLGQSLLQLMVRMVRSAPGPMERGRLSRQVRKLELALRRKKFAIALENRLARLSWAIVGQPFRVIAPSLEIPLAMVDLQGVTEAEREMEARRRAIEEAHAAFDLIRGPLLRAKLIRLGPEDQIFMLTLHHLICDGWSMAVLARELRLCYEAYRSGDSPDLPELRVQYADYAAWRRKQVQGAAFERLVDYWKKRLQGLPPTLPLPADGPRSGSPSQPSATVLFTIPPHETQALKKLSQGENATLFLVLLAIFELLLYRLSGLDDIAVAITVAERPTSELQELIGFFVGLTVVRTDLSGDPAFSELLKRVSKTLLDAFEHQESSAIAEALMREIGVQEYARLRGSSFKAFFTWVNVPKIESVFPQLDTKPYSLPEGKAEIGPDVVLQGWENNEGIDFRVIYKKPLFSPVRMKAFTENFAALARQIIEAPDKRISQYSLETRVDSSYNAGMAAASDD